MAERKPLYTERIRVEASGLEASGLEAEALRFRESVATEANVRRALKGSRWRLLYTRARDEDEDVPDQPDNEAVLYDYTRNRTVLVRGAAGSRGGFQINYSQQQPVPSVEEWEEAVQLVRASPVWGNLLTSGYATPYEPMPPMLEPDGDEAVERTIYVGLASKPRQFNRIVAVNLVRGTVSRQDLVPPHSRAAPRTCGVPADNSCTRPNRGKPGSLTLQWPTDNPVWSLQAIRPASSSGVNGSGLELRDVKYRGKSVLTRAHVPILNVRYNQNKCGPYRDWLYTETCFQATGTDIAGSPGFRWCTEPPQTILDSGQDGGNFVGVAVWEPGDGSLSLITQMYAGWYRYTMEWRLYEDGRILPRFGFDGVSNSCVCNSHHHHVFWRFDFDVVTQKNVLEEAQGGTWKVLAKETSRRRTEGQPISWRVRDPVSGAGYEIVEGPEDGIGEKFSGADCYALRYRKSELDDKRSQILRNAATDLDRYLTKESIDHQNLVVWYSAHFLHTVTDQGIHSEDHSAVGPTLQPFAWPA